MQDNATISKDDLGELTQAEIELIYSIRHKWRHGKMEIEIRDGAPTFIIRTVERERLGEK